MIKPIGENAENTIGNSKKIENWGNITLRESP